MWDTGSLKCEGEFGEFRGGQLDAGARGDGQKMCSEQQSVKGIPEYFHYSCDVVELLQRLPTLRDLSPVDSNPCGKNPRTMIIVVLSTDCMLSSHVSLHSDFRARSII